MRLSKDEYINELNSSINLLKTRVVYEKLGPAYSEMSVQDASRNLIFHRMFKNFEEPDEQRQENVKDQSVFDVFLFDENQGNSDGRFSRLTEVVKKHMYQLREKMQKDCAQAQPKYSCSITTGENVFSRNGDTSVFSKLVNIDAWTCSPQNIGKAVTIVSRTRLLRRMLAYHYDKLLWEQYVKKRNVLPLASILALPKSHWRVYRKRHYSFMKRKHGNQMLCAMFKKVVTLTSFARITTVPKDNEKARVIITCPLFDMISQRDDAATIKSILHARYGIQLGFTQQVQRGRIRDYRNCTVDFANASNSTRLDSVKFLLGNTSFYKKHLSVSRIGECYYKEHWHNLNMFSPMGCGSTFELMTWILTAAARLFDETATVFGDDVVIKSECLPQFLELSHALGYEVNVSKTFTEGAFRESCGEFLSHNIPLKSYQFEWAQDYFDAVVLTNKIRLVRHGIPELERLYMRLISKLPLLTFKMAPDDHPVLDDGVPSSENLVRKQYKCMSTSSRFKALRKNHAYAARSSRITQYYMREVLEKVCEPLWENPRIDHVTLGLYASYVYNMRCEAPVLRNTEHTTSKIVLCEINNNLPVTFA